MTNKIALQQRSWQNASLTDQSCSAYNSLTAGMFHCKFTCEISLLTQRHYDQQKCTSAKIVQKCIRSELCADDNLTAGMFHCKFTCESSLLTQRHYDQQECTAAQISQSCCAEMTSSQHVLHAKMHELLCRKQPDSRHVSLQVYVKFRCSHKGTMTNKSALAAKILAKCISLTGLLCRQQPDSSALQSLLLAQRHYDQQECTAAQILPKCIPH